MSNTIQISATEFVAHLGDTLADWALGADYTVTVFDDGTVNALAGRGEAIYDLAAGNPEATERVAALYAKLDAEDAL